jgi:hypothetical protein
LFYTSAAAVLARKGGRLHRRAGSVAFEGPILIAIYGFTLVLAASLVFWMIRIWIAGWRPA